MHVLPDFSGLEFEDPDHDDASDGDGGDALGGVWERIHRRIEQHLRLAERETALLVEGPLEPGSLDSALVALVDLAGWLGELGMVSAARLARQLHQRLKDPAHMAQASPEGAVVAAGLIEDLRSSVDTTAGGGRSTTLGEDLLVIGDPSQAVDSLIWFAVTSGFAVHHSSRLQNWPERASAIVVVGEAHHSIESILLSTRLASERYPGVPLVVVSASDDPSERCDLASHATSLMRTSARPSDVVDEVRRNIHLGRRTERVAVRGPRGGAMAADLGDRGISAWFAEDDRELLLGLDSGRASAVVLMPSDDNARLIRLIRGQASTRRTVIVEMVAFDTRPTPEAAVDLTLESSRHINSIVRELQALLRLRADVDADLAATSRTGGIPWSSARFLAERLLLGVHRSNAVASLCVVQFDESDDLAQIDAVQEQLLREFRTDDIVTRSGDRETILVLGGVDRAVSSSRLEGMAGRLSSVGIRVGIAEFPYDAQSVGDLVTEARTLVERSRAEDGPRVVSADWHPGGLVAHDVIIADSDPAVARVVGEALERSGVSVAHISDGQLLLERLQSPNVRLPKVLILEFDLLGVDGLTILRRLKRKSALRRFDVVMLSARTREADIRQAYDLGVTEVIAKPFSPGILVRRLLRLMEVEL